MLFMPSVLGLHDDTDVLTNIRDGPSIGNLDFGPTKIIHDLFGGIAFLGIVTPYGFQLLLSLSKLDPF